MTERFRAGSGFLSLTTPAMSDSISLNYDTADQRPNGEGRIITHFGFRLENLADLDNAIADVIAAGAALSARKSTPPIPTAS